MAFNKDKFVEITSKGHTAQAVWFLNGFWNDGAEGEAEKIWDYVHLMIEVETGKPKLYGKRKDIVKEGCDLDELQSHVFLEKLGNIMTVRELRNRLKKLDVDNNNRLALSEFLLDKFTKTPLQLVNAPQGDTDPVKLAAAQKALDDASDALDTAVDATNAAKTAQRELEVAVADLHAQEKAYNDKVAELENLSENGSSSIKKLKAKNELAQLKGEDPLPLRRAKLTAASAVKRGPQCVKAAKELFQAAEDVLYAIKMAGDGVAQGAIWWMERELAEKKKFMPR